jgi:hypothetical protein
MRLICDTSVWYKLSEKREFLERFQNVQLVSTLSSFLEITTAPQFYKEKKNLTACDLMCKNSKFLPQNPWEYLTEDANLQNQWVVEAFNRLKSSELKSNITEINFDNIQITTWVDERKQAAQETVNCINEAVRKIKQDPRLNPGKKEIDKLHNLYREEIIKGFVSLQTRLFYMGQSRDANWSNSQFFLTMFTNYMILLVKSEQKSAPNDVADLYNMIYVRKADKYLTNDKKTWLNISKQNPYTAERFLYFDDIVSSSISQPTRKHQQ